MEENIETELREIGLEVVDLIYLVQGKAGSEFF
jgi:hypothetical protein